MPLDVDTLKLDFNQAIEDAQSKQTLEDSLNAFIQGMANAIDKFVRSGDVETTGTAEAQSGKII